MKRSLEKAHATQVSVDQHRCVVLFYKYFIPTSTQKKIPDAALLQEYGSHYMPLLLEYMERQCHELGMKGRILLAAEGINGTLSCSSTDPIMKKFIGTLENFNLVRDLGAPSPLVAPYSESSERIGDGKYPSVKADSQDCSGLFTEIDWKLSTIDNDQTDISIEPFPDLKISIVSEIVSSGGRVRVSEIPEWGGTHLSPDEFHAVLMGEKGENKVCIERYKDELVGIESQEVKKKSKEESKNVVLIDVRNTFEHAVGHFVDPKTSQAALNPEMVTFSSFDSRFCSAQADFLKDKKVLMYCTGGIRCEKASAMLRKRGVNDVSQLSGGIHRYLERYGSSGFFKGKNFVFDQRVAVAPSPVASLTSPDNGCGSDDIVPAPYADDGSCIVGKCGECETAYDEISGSRICTVCRDLVLVCSSCQKGLREYHCIRHKAWKACYFTFVEVFDASELQIQIEELSRIRDSLSSQFKNQRRTLLKQINKAKEHQRKLENGESIIQRDAPRRCRTCFETEAVCDGLCW
eukprot:CAMPEP_0198287980 /NCGR_PEP_ID=MMETSP1449-20131203/6633_1 /TAXON_ID=420275 /ORGANISM="Attheya septentrionalis, Strain CCMP2084" /LENGTH=518 /DNA_ID=CAMNT_0043986057 /DNA_START=219 /DNA_END=1772 /DNA_ORIENTATION=+